MADYIKRDDIFDMIIIGKLEYPECGSAFDGMETEVRHIPSADVVKVVRCKDCKNNYVTTRNHGKQDDPRCDFTDRHLSLDDFCSRGERRMGGGT